jgi:hypothetical protein
VGDFSSFVCWLFFIYPSPFSFLLTVNYIRKSVPEAWAWGSMVEGMRQTRQGLTTPEDHRSTEASSSSFWFLPGGGCFSCLCIPIRRQQRQQLQQRQPSPALSLTTASPNTIAATSMVQMFYYENRGKCCKKLLRYNGYPSKVRNLKTRHVLPAMYRLLHALQCRLPLADSTHNTRVSDSEQLLITSRVSE